MEVLKQGNSLGLDSIICLGCGDLSIEFHWQLLRSALGKCLVLGGNHCECGYGVFR